MDANLESLKGLEKNLEEQGHDIARIPLVMQWNKRDLPNVSSVEELSRQINKWNVPYYFAYYILRTVS